MMSPGTSQSLVCIKAGCISCSSAGCYSAGVGWGLRFCTSNKLPGDAKAVGLWTTLKSKELAQGMQMSSNPEGVVVAAFRTRLKVL